jgi:hypothetical protein
MAKHRGGICLDNSIGGRLPLRMASMSKLFDLRHRISSVHPSFPVSGNRDDLEAGESKLPHPT